MLGGPRHEHKFSDTNLWSLILGCSVFTKENLQIYQGCSSLAKRIKPWKTKRNPIFQKSVRNPNHHYFSKSIAIHLQIFVLQYASNLYCSAFGAPTLGGKGNTVLLCVSQYAFHLYRNMPPICIAVLLGKSWWRWSPGCFPILARNVLAKKKINQRKSKQSRKGL